MLATKLAQMASCKIDFLCILGCGVVVKVNDPKPPLQTYNKLYENF